MGLDVSHTLIFITTINIVAGGYCYYSATCYTSRYVSTKYHYTKGWFSRFYAYKSRLVTRSYQCSKAECCTGFTGSSCSQAICFGSTTCQNGGTCTTPNQCNCPPGFSSPNCGDIDECSTNNGDCSDHCTNTVGSYQCSCDNGYILDTDGKTCIATCFGSTDCLNGGTCLSPDNCSCIAGFAKPKCEDINECLVQNGGCAQHCNNTQGSNECYCDSGLSIDQNTGKNCTDDDECLTDNGGCEQICVNEYRSFHCECRNGLQLASDNKLCEDINECLTSSRCSQTCSNIYGSYICGCNQGYYLSADGITCKNTDDCIGVDCKNGASCLDGVDNFICQCLPGFDGSYCEKDIDECGLGNGGCEETCVNTVGSYICQCVNGLNADGTCKQLNDAVYRSVFEVHKIPRKLLPKGCAVLELMSCDHNSPDRKIIFSSTDDWFQMSTNTSVFHTYGIVFVEVDSLSIPVSVTGLKVVSTKSGFELSFGALSYPTQNDIKLDTKRNEDCFFFSTTPKDVSQLLRSFVPTFFTNMEDVLPRWISLSKKGSNIVSLSDLRTDMLYGRELKTDPVCKGAPLYDTHLYNVFRIGDDFNISLFENGVTLPKTLVGNKVCFLIDICQDKAGTVYILLPPESRDILDRFEFMKSIFSSFGVQFRPRGIGLSLPGSINVEDTVSSLQFWNGYDHFSYRTLTAANVWLDTSARWFLQKGAFELTVDVRADLFIGTPNLSSLLTGMYVDEWNVLFRVRELFATPALRFMVFGEMVLIEFKNIVAASLDVYISIGGSSNRVWCGNGANPEGIYASFYVFNFNPFRNIPLIKEWVFDANVRMFAFLPIDTSDVDLQNRPIDILNDILDLKQVVNDFKAMIMSFIERLKNVVSETVGQLLVELRNISSSLLVMLEELIANGILSLGNVTSLVSKLWQTFKDSMMNIVDKILDKVEFDINTSVYDMKEYVHRKAKEIRAKLFNMIKKTRDEVLNVGRHTTGFGFKFSADIRLIGLGFGQLDVEVVHSLDRLGECSKFHKVYSILRGEKSLKILGRFVESHTFGYFIKTEVVDVPIEGRKSSALSIAFSLSKFKFVAHFNAYITVLGLKVSGDILISNKVIMFQIEGNIWNVFFARISFEASIGKSWYDLIFNVQGELLVKQGENNFGGSYLDGLYILAEKVVHAANKRLDIAKDGLQSAQRGITWAQDKLSLAQQKIRGAHTAFDSAIRSLDYAKFQLERAKRPFKDAIKRLQEVQRRVDRMCRIRSCSSFCVPGFRRRWCRGWITYPCFKWTSCLFKVHDIFCEIANAACRILRDLAYGILEAAKLVVRIFMVPLDIAKAALSVAQCVVNTSRVVLYIAEGLFEVAKIGLQTAKWMLDVAKEAIDVIKLLLKAALYVFDLIIKTGLQSLIDVRNCRFQFQLSTTDRSFFDVSCEVQAFRLGWHTFKFEFDFKNPILSMWRIAKSTIETLFSFVKNLFGERKRRELSYDAMTKLHRILQIYKRDVGIDLNQTNFSDSFNDTSSQDYGTYFKDRFRSKIEYFAFNCNTFLHLYSFLSDSIDKLISITTESVETLKNTTKTKDYINTNITSYNSTDYNKTADSFGVNTEYAFQEFNISQEQIDLAIQGVLANLSKDPYISQMINSSEEAANYIDNQIAEDSSVSIMKNWIQGMVNSTKEHFDESKCYGFKDCVLYAFSELYDVFSDSSIPGVNESRKTTMSLEDQLMNLITNDSWTINESYDISLQIQSYLESLNKTNTWCSTEPVISLDLTNKTTLVGNTVNFTCNVIGDPIPDIQWYFNNSIIEKENGEVLSLNGVQNENEGKYRCEAENLLTNVKSANMHLIITECESGSYFDGRICVPCAKGYYQPLKDQVECNKCGNDQTTSTVGTEQEEECYVERQNTVLKIASAVVGGFAGLALLVFAYGYFVKATKIPKVKTLEKQEYPMKSLSVQVSSNPECKGDVVKKQQIVNDSLIVSTLPSEEK